MGTGSAAPAAVPPAPARAAAGPPTTPAHAESEGFLLRAAQGESVRPGPACPAGAPVRSYDVAAIGVDITLNRYLDHDPLGEMFALTADLPRVRAEDAANARARAAGGPLVVTATAGSTVTGGVLDSAVTIGLQGDAIQPLTLRVRQGECLRITLHNQLPRGEPVELHLHGSSLTVRGGGPATAANPAATAGPGGTVTYEWAVGAREQPGTHYFHSHALERTQTDHGLFGAVIVEPAGSSWLDPATDHPLTTGWAAVVVPPDAGAFREFVLYYHEIGDENYQLLDRSDNFIPLVDPELGAYRPAARALNYRSEPFANRMSLQKLVDGEFDESASYSSAVFGDPATPLMRSYLGERVIQRIVHAGAEVLHVHHVHGGSIRWHRQPGLAPADPPGLTKHPPLLPGDSDLTDAQAIGPSETFDTENECGAGGCQQSAGDFMYHCHVAHHYFAGMWGIWRVYNTLQAPGSQTDDLTPLPELPGRTGDTPAAVASDQLVAAHATAGPAGQPLTASTLAGWVEQQLPPPGVPKGYDAAVMDWARQGDRYLAPAEDTRAWPGYRPMAPGTRPPILFDARTGLVAYPLLQPHFGSRPPFAPNHGPAPFLDPTPNGADPPPPGGSGPFSVCPTGTRPDELAINAITVPLTLNRKENLTDPTGELYVLRDQEAAVRAEGGDALRRPLAIRANAGQDCVDVLFRSELEDNAINHMFAKADIHIHFVQFDVQGSDGVDTGFNYEQGVRPYTVEGERLAAPTPAGATTAVLGSTTRFQPGEVVGVGMDQDASFEARRIAAVQGTTLVFDRPLAFPHGAGEIASTEFVRYRWYPDVEFGTAYFHDHVNALSSWAHGLFGALIAEPPDSSYHDPQTGAALPSGPAADIHTTGTASADVRGSFREQVMFIQDDNAITSVGRSSGSSLNLRVEPLDDRTGNPAELFSSTLYGDPETPVIRAYLGDPVVVRTLVAATNDVHTWHIDGHSFRAESFDSRAPPVDTIHVGISERYDLSIPAAGGAQRLPGDYLYYDGRSYKLREGAWGLLRVLAQPTPSLQPLPGHESLPVPASSVCPAGAPGRTFSVAALAVPLPMLATTSPPRMGKVFVMESSVASVASGRTAPGPLVLHADVGDCITVHLRNATGGPVSLHPDQLAFDPARSAGVAAGAEPVQAAPPGGTYTYTWYAPPEVGPTAALLQDFGDPLHNLGAGLYGAVIVGPRGATYRDPGTGADASATSSWAVDVHTASGSYRDFSLFLQDEDAGIGTHRMPYTTRVDGPVGINYQATPFTGPRPAAASTPVLMALAGDPVHIHVLVPFSEQDQVFSVEGQRWPVEAGVPGSTLVSSLQVGADEAVTLVLAGGAGSGPGVYEYGDARAPYREAGMWGTFRVSCPGALPIRPLASSTTPAACAGAPTLVRRAALPVAVVAGGGAVLVARRRRRQPR
ncbi:MAG TPA: multicopper oxidase domain-containing protein [Actinomycetota bacterium]|nr:multicopper oxidase domain-containing protein [Actinomycetota bacterium]